MTLRKKVLIIIAATFLSLIVILYLASQIILLNSFNELEEQHTHQNVERALDALSHDFSSLEALAGDWAAWDDTYAFIEDANDEYVQSNLVYGTFTELRLNFMLFINSSGRTVFSKAFDLHNEEEIPIPESLQKHLSGNDFLLTHPDTESSIAGIILLPEEPMLIASQPILPSEDEGPIRGTLIMGRYLDAVEIERLAEITHLSLIMHRFDDPQMPPDFQAAHSSLSEEAPILARPLDEQSIAGYALLKDIYGKPSLVLRVDMPRDIYQQGQKSLTYRIWLIVIVGAVCCGVAMWFLEKQALSQLTRLSKSVSSIGKTGDFSKRVSLAGTDELSNLAGDINRMIGALEQSKEELRKAYAQETKLRQELQTEIQRRIEFTRALVHELKTPLTPVLAASDVLVAKLQEEPLLSFARNINRGASNLNRRIDELLDLARSEIGVLQIKPKPVEPLHLLHEVAGEMAPVASSYGQSLTLDLPPSLSPIRADKDRLRQVVLNLLNNASKFTPEGGNITLRAKEKDAFLIVEVQGTGPGISEEEQQRLFQPYYRRESDREHLSGLGLGLALCKTLVELHGGQIWVESQEGKGSTFSFSMPLETANQREESAETGGKS